MEKSIFCIEDLEARLEMAEWTASAGVTTTTTTVNGSTKTETVLGGKLVINF